jgi:NAD+ synthase
MQIKDKIVSWISEYFAQNATSETNAVIGISGGKDSTVAAALCVAALGKERVYGVLMPQGEQPDIDVSYAVCEHLGIRHIEVDIGETIQTLYDAIDVNGLELKEDTVRNTPARLRMTTLYAVAASLAGGGRVVNTGNASESYVGWETKFGDSVGDFSPLGGLTVGEVKSVGYELGVPPEWLEKVPIDGLCGKTDEEALGFTYETLDKYIREGVCENETLKTNIEKLHKQSEHKRVTMPIFTI